jgi:general secretion pathway protein B
MSFILDALKKSEIERQRQSAPGLIDNSITQRRNRLPVWALALGVLLGVNLIVLAFTLTRKSAPLTTHASRAAVTAPAPDVNAAPPAAQHFSPLDPAPVYAPEIPVATLDNPAPIQTPLTRTGPIAGSGSAAAHRAPRPDPLLTDENTNTENQEVLPSISEISLNGAQALPELHLDVHVYATKPAERFVYINMRKYHEGAPLQEGPTVERIRRDGVVLNYQGLRFILPRQP